MTMPATNPASNPAKIVFYCSIIAHYGLKAGKESNCTSFSRRAAVGDESDAKAPHSKNVAPTPWIQHSRPELVTRGGFKSGEETQSLYFPQPHLHSQELSAHVPPPSRTSPASCRRDRTGTGSGVDNCMANTAGPRANRFRPLVRSDVNGIRRTEDADHRFAQRRGDVHRTGVIRHHHLSTMDQRCQI